jgi:hypothetical protein
MFVFERRARLWLAHQDADLHRERTSTTSTSSYRSPSSPSMKRSRTFFEPALTDRLSRLVAGVLRLVELVFAYLAV